MKVLVGSQNKVKVAAAEEAFKEYFEGVVAEGIKVESNVADQPVNEDIYRGARNRVDNLIKYAKENNIEELKVTASAKNVNAILFYKKNGLEEFDVTLKMKI